MRVNVVDCRPLKDFPVRTIGRDLGEDSSLCVLGLISAAGWVRYILRECHVTDYQSGRSARPLHVELMKILGKVVASIMPARLNSLHKLVVWTKYTCIRTRAARSARNRAAVADPTKMRRALIVAGLQIICLEAFLDCGRARPDKILPLLAIKPYKKARARSPHDYRIL